MTTQHPSVVEAASSPPAYSAAARHFHWLTAAAVLVMLPLGLGMSYRGNTLDIWDGVTDALYSTHKLIGFMVLWLVAGRLIYRLRHGAPPDEPGLSWLDRTVSHLVHWLLYGLLLAVPLLGWIGVSLYPSLSIFNLFDLPKLAATNQGLAEAVLKVHGNLAIFAAAVAGVHIAAALYHHLIRRNGVLRRMWPGPR